MKIIRYLSLTLLFILAVPALSQAYDTENLVALFPQAVAGGGWKTRIDLVSVSQRSFTGTIEMFTSTGEPFRAFRNGHGILNHFRVVELQPGGSRTVETTSEGELQTGIVLVRGDNFLTEASLQYQTEENLLSVQPGFFAPRWTVRTETNLGDEIFTGIAISNPNPTTINVDIEFPRRTGSWTKG